MSPSHQRVFRGGPIFDGTQLFHGWAVRFDGDLVAAIGPEHDVKTDGQAIDLEGDILSPGFVDLQVNGGGGVMFNDGQDVGALRAMTHAHRRAGSTSILPTLISDRPDKTRAAIAAVRDAIDAGVPGIAGLHLEGPHLALARKGAHDAAHLRETNDDDLAMLSAAAQDLPLLKVTLAPEAASAAQVRRLAQAGVLVAIGHTDASFETCRTYVDAGARVVTHLFNAMSQLGSRAPGVVGAALADGRLSAGLIADGHHVRPEVMAMAWAAKRGPGALFLVSDAMAVAGTDLDRFELGGREIMRRGGRLTLADGTLAGADLTLTRALRVLTGEAGVPLASALGAATRVPAQLIGSRAGRLVAGAPADPIRIAADLSGATPVFGDQAPS